MKQFAGEQISFFSRRLIKEKPMIALFPKMFQNGALVLALGWMNQSIKYFMMCIITRLTGEDSDNREWIGDGIRDLRSSLPFRIELLELLTDIGSSLPIKHSGFHLQPGTTAKSNSLNPIKYNTQKPAWLLQPHSYPSNKSTYSPIFPPIENARQGYSPHITKPATY
ncbi:unnamed protein product [Periconia digitata]|uniref:Uncharacterized protein n=1 Tax=Periconia digitata TaxID=1303443 RepID=A0A9W4U5W5_9PLEO|nr:unnamed protein product [Periconia digitata]